MADADVLNRLKGIRDDYLTALENDAQNPQPNYSLDGESIDRVTWRKALFDEIERLNDLIAKYEPFEERSFIL